MPRPWLVLPALLGVLTHSLNAQASRPRLEVLIVVDQLRPDYFARYEAQFSGGLTRFGRQGTFFTNARQDHAVTETAPGHSTVLSGRSPSSTGIVSNALGVLDSSTILLQTHSAPGASPRRFQGTGLFDWLLARDSAARVLAVSRKDRAAILPVGRARGNVYWYANGEFTTSSWYADTLPGWLAGWNARRGAAKLAGKAWAPLLSPSSYLEADSMPYENGQANVTFPHLLPADTGAAIRKVVDTPWMDSLTLDVALEGARRMSLGQRPGTDLLVVSLSTTDEVGHAFGPESMEMHDQLLRLDKWLGWFLDSLAVLVPPDATVLAFTADHGVQPFPERTGIGGRTSLTAIARNTARELQRRYRVPLGVDFDSGLLTADVAALRARGVNVDSLADALAALARSRPGVARVFTPRSLAAAKATDEEARLWRRTIPPSQGWLLAASTLPGWLWADTPGWTTHGSTQVLDMSVPIVFLGAGVRAHMSRAGSPPRTSGRPLRRSPASSPPNP